MAREPAAAHPALRHGERVWLARLPDAFSRRARHPLQPGPVLHPTRPADKSLGDSLAGSPPAQKLGERGCSKVVRGNRREEGEHGLALADVDVLCLLDEANVPAQGCAVVLLEVPSSEQEGQLERLCEADEVELRGGGEGFGDVPAIEGSAEAHVSRALSSHERMFPCLSILCKDRGSSLHPFARA